MKKFNTSDWTIARDDDDCQISTQPELLRFNHFQFGHRPLF